VGRPVKTSFGKGRRLVSSKRGGFGRKDFWITFYEAMRVTHRSGIMSVKIRCALDL